MMGTSNPQPSMFYHINIEQCVTADHPGRKIRPLIDNDRIRQLCEPLYSDEGRPSLPLEQLFWALLGGYLLSVSSARALVRELHGNLVLRWCGGLDLDAEPWDHTTFAQNRTRRFNTSGLLEQLFDGVTAQFEETVETDAGSVIAHGHAGAGRAGEGERWKSGREHCNTNGN